MTRDYALDELMVVEAARYIDDGDIVLVGTGLPFAASLFAQKSGAPHMCYVVETGPISPEVIPTPISVSDARVMYRAARIGSLVESLGGVLQRGMADVAFLGGAQIDQYANVNSTVIGDYDKPKVRFPGSGGANDLASHARKILIITRHEKRRFPANCDYITSPGYIDGPDGRGQGRPALGLPRHIRHHRPCRVGNRQVGGAAADREADARRELGACAGKHRIRANARPRNYRGGPTHFGGPSAAARRGRPQRRVPSRPGVGGRARQGQVFKAVSPLSPYRVRGRL